MRSERTVGFVRTCVTNLCDSARIISSYALIHSDCRISLYAYSQVSRYTASLMLTVMRMRNTSYRCIHNHSRIYI